MESITDDLVWLLLDDATGEAIRDRREVRVVIEAAAGVDARCGTSLRRSRGRVGGRAETLTSVAGRLSERSRVCAMPIRRLGLLPGRCFPTLDYAGKKALRASLRGALWGEQPSNRRISELIALLASVDALAAQFPDIAVAEVERACADFLNCRTDYWQLAQQVRAAICRDYARSFGSAA